MVVSLTGGPLPTYYIKIKIRLIILTAYRNAELPMPGSSRYAFAPSYDALQDILTDHKLASLGDAYTNFVYSLYLSVTTGKPVGAKADGRLLSKAFKQAGLRDLLSSRVDRHKQADAAEALLVYVWLQGLTTISETVGALAKYGDVEEAFGSLLSSARKKLNL
jgi:hypothetical protein